MWSLLQLAAALALPLLAFGVMLWFLMYSSFRLAFRHEVTRLEREEKEARAAAERARRRQARTQSESIGGDGQPRPRPAPKPAPQRQAAKASSQPPAGQRRAAS